MANMDNGFKGFGSNQFKVKYKETALQNGPSGISGYLGTLKKGAVVEVIADEHPYYYKVRLDNGLEGYIYKAAGELTSGLSLTRATAVTEDSTPTKSVDIPLPESETASTNGNGSSFSSMNARNGSTMRPARAATARPARPPAVQPASRNGNGLGELRSSSGSRLGSRGGRTVVVTSGEIAVFDQPGIVGRQVGKLKRGDKVSLVNQDSFFFEVSLPNGQSGFIPRYAAETE